MVVPTVKEPVDLELLGVISSGGLEHRWWRNPQPAAKRQHVKPIRGVTVPARDDDIPDIIGELTQSGMTRLPESLRSWTDAHLCAPPRQETFAVNSDGSGAIRLWLVTEHTGDEDSNCRVVFDSDKRSFGLVMGLQGGIEWFMGPYAGDFADVVMAM